MKALPIAVMALVSVWSVTAQTTATLLGDSTHFLIGDLLPLKLVVKTGANNAVVFPKIEGDTLGRLEIISRSKIDTAKTGTQIVYAQTLHVSAYDSGQYYIPPIAVFYGGGGRLDTVFTNELLISVSTIDVDTTKAFKPIKAPLAVPYVWREYIWWIVLAVLWLLLIGAGYWLYQRYKKEPKEVPVRPRPKDPAHIWAAKELKKLEDEKLWQQGEVKQYHSRLSDILRSYLEYRYDYYALESTTEEIQTEISSLNIGMDASSKLMEALRLADFVKFAKLNPAPDQNMLSMHYAQSFVEMTKPLPTQQEPATTVSPSKKKKRK